MKIDYNEFLFYNLTQTQTKHPLYQIEYDIAWQDLPYYYEQYYKSNYYNEDTSEYECMINYLTNYNENTDTVHDKIKYLFKQLLK